MIVWLDDVAAGDAERVGGKGANLGECAHLGLRVPAGFCVTTDAYREATSGLSRCI
ncbi:MAG: PEP/pyruvate-binding domain-containing protein [Microlunatus sp.]